MVNRQGYGGTTLCEALRLPLADSLPLRMTELAEVIHPYTQMKNALTFQSCSDY